MTIAYIEPLRRAWARMNKALFQPFDIAKWCTLGFTAFLAQLLAGGYGGSFRFPSGNMGNIGAEEIADLPGKALHWFQENTLWLIFVLIGLFLLAVVLVALTWVRSRGEFMFLDNVVKDKAEIAEPWRRFEIPGNSLFLWRLSFAVIYFMIVFMMVAVCFGVFVVYYRQGFSLSGLLYPILGISVALIVFMAAMVAAAYINLFLHSFVIPIMYKHDVSVLKSWERFLPILKKHPLDFFVYGLFLYALHFAIGLGMLILGCLTCCLALIILAIPYVGSVILLPVTCTLRWFSLEYLAQFGPEFSLLPELATSAFPQTGKEDGQERA